MSSRALRFASAALGAALALGLAAASAQTGPFRALVVELDALPPGAMAVREQLASCLLRYGREVMGARLTGRAADPTLVIRPRSVHLAPATGNLLGHDARLGSIAMGAVDTLEGTLAIQPSGRAGGGLAIPFRATVAASPSDNGFGAPIQHAFLRTDGLCRAAAGWIPWHLAGR